MTVITSKRNPGEIAAYQDGFDACKFIKDARIAELEAQLEKWRVVDSRLLSLAKWAVDHGCTLPCPPQLTCPDCKGSGKVKKYPNNPGSGFTTPCHCASK